MAAHRLLAPGSAGATANGHEQLSPCAAFVGKVNSDMANDIVIVDPNAVSHVYTMIR